MATSAQFLWLLVPIGLNVLHGCIALPEERLEFEVLGSEVRAGQCLAGLDPTGFDCHLIRLDVRNLDERNATAADLLDFRGVVGVNHVRGIVERNVTIPAGGTAVVHVGFTIPAGHRVAQVILERYPDDIRRDVP